MGSGRYEKRNHYLYVYQRVRVRTAVVAVVVVVVDRERSRRRRGSERKERSRNLSTVKSLITSSLTDDLPLITLRRGMRDKQAEKRNTQMVKNESQD